MSDQSPSQQIVNDIVQRSIEIVQAHKHEYLTATEVQQRQVSIQLDLIRAREHGRCVIYYDFMGLGIGHVQPYELAMLLSLNL